MVAVIEKKDLRDFDFMIAFLAIGISAFGVWQIFYAQPTEDFNYRSFWVKQIFGIVFALIPFTILALGDYRRLVDAAPLLYGIGLFLLVIVLIPGIGMKLNGQRCWINLGFTQFQPSEFVKIPTALMLAKFFGARKGGTLTWSEFFIGCAILLGPVGLIMLEPDAGQSLTYFPLLGVCFFLSGIKIRYVLMTILAALILTPIAFWIGTQVGVVKPYHVARIEAILDPEKADPRGFGYHTIQSMITVGKGGLTGNTGDTETSQSALKFLPEPHSDFIFAVTAENTGFLGCISLLLAYALLLSRMIAGARDTSDRAGMLLLMGFSGVMATQIFFNIGMVLGFLPVIGVPLPFMSAGLSAILSNFIVLGLVISVKMRRFVN